MRYYTATPIAGSRNWVWAVEVEELMSEIVDSASAGVRPVIELATDLFN